MVESLSVGDDDTGEVQEVLSSQRLEFAPVLLHVGLHKTGSTWVQKRLFKDSKRGFTDKTGEPRDNIIKRLVMHDPLFFDAPATAAHYAPTIEAANASGLTLVLSHERLSGHPSSGGIDRCIIAERLKATFPDARILVVIREQRALIASMYALHIRLGGVESLRRYLSTPEPGAGRKHSFTFEMYEFDRLIAFYRSLFGESRVLILPLELLAREPQDFADRIGSFCGHPSVPLGPTKRLNVRHPRLLQLTQRPLNMLFYHNELSPGAIVHIPNFTRRYAEFAKRFGRFSPDFLERKLQKRQRIEIEALVGDRFAMSNRRTQEMTGLPLAELGYPV